jgi:hypothetical protein
VAWSSVLGTSGTSAGDGGVGSGAGEGVCFRR